MVAGGAALTALLVGQGEIEMHVGVSRHGASGAAQMVDRFFEFTQLLERAAKVVARNAIQRVEFDRGTKGGTRIGKLAHLVIGHAQIDVGFDPVRRKLDDALVILDCLRKHFLARLAIQRILEKLFRRRACHRMQFRRTNRDIEGEDPLLAERIERALGTGRDDQNFAALFDEVKLLQRKGTSAELLLDQGDRASQFSRGNSIFCEPLDGSQGDQVAETVETFAPAGLRTYQAQPLPITKPAGFKPQNSPDFSSRITVCQAGVPPGGADSSNDYAPAVKSWSRKISPNIAFQEHPSPARQPQEDAALHASPGLLDF